MGEIRSKTCTHSLASEFAVGEIFVRAGSGIVSGLEQADVTESFFLLDLKT